MDLGSGTWLQQQHSRVIAFQDHHLMRHRNINLLIGLSILMITGLLPRRMIDGGPRSPAPSSSPCLRTSQIVELVKSLHSASGVGDSYDAAIKLAFGDAPQNAHTLTAFEENRSFVYATGDVAPGMVRRLIVLKPSILVIDDQAPPGSQGTACLDSESAPNISPGRVRVVEGEYEITWEIPQPQKASYATARAAGYVVGATSQSSPAATRFLHVFYVVDKGHAGPPAHATLAPGQGSWELTVPTEDRVFHFWLPAASEGAGEIVISAPDGNVQVNRQPLPSGILPHGAEGNRLLETWDADYRGKNPPAWDIGRPADDLQKLVKEAKVRKCRVVDLGCGSGTDAIFLASQGFEVTGIDISPTALGQAAEKARKAGVSVRWVLADVTAPPSLGPFDFIYDRGCYHNVRDQNLEAYMETVRRFSHDGTKLLLLSARRDPQSRSSGVTEEELRFDFSSLFQVEWLREIMLESNEAGVNAPSWSALLRRNGKS